MRFSGKNVLVTGGGRGIGRAIVARFLAEGAHVIIAQRSAPDLPDELGNVTYIAADFSDPDACQALIPACLGQVGGLDVLVNNAGMMVEARAEEMDLAAWQRSLMVNLTAPFLLARAAIPAMRQRGGGAIVNIGSIEGLGANPRHAAYCASKAGLHGLTQALAIDEGGDNIRCNTVAPGWIDTDLNEDFINAMPDPAAFRAQIGMIHPVGRTGKPEEIASMVAYLASDEAAFITGQIFTVDGGRMAKLSLP